MSDIRRWTDDTGRLILDWKNGSWASLGWSALANVAALAGLYALWCLMVWLAVLGLAFVGMMP